MKSILIKSILIKFFLMTSILMKSILVSGWVGRLEKVEIRPSQRAGAEARLSLAIIKIL